MMPIQSKKTKWVVLIILVSVCCVTLYTKSKADQYKLVDGGSGTYLFRAKAEIEAIDTDKKTIKVNLLEKNEFFDKDYIILDCRDVSNFDKYEQGQQIIFKFFHSYLNKEPLLVYDIKLVDV